MFPLFSVKEEKRGNLSLPKTPGRLFSGPDLLYDIHVYERK
jgi:hypothetical protein